MFVIYIVSTVCCKSYKSFPTFLFLNKRSRKGLYACNRYFFQLVFYILSKHSSLLTRQIYEKYSFLFFYYPSYFNGLEKSRLNIRFRCLFDILYYQVNVRHQHIIVDKYVENPMIKLLITQWISTALCQHSAMSGYPQRFEKDKMRFSTVFHQ